MDAPADERQAVPPRAVTAHPRDLTGQSSKSPRLTHHRLSVLLIDQGRERRRVERLTARGQG